MNDHDLAVHLQNHWAAASAGVDFAHRVARSHQGSPAGAALDEVYDDIREDRESLRAIMAGAGVQPGVVMPLVARVSERLGRFKPNGHLVRRSPVSDVLELEAFRGAVTAKGAGWETLLVLAEHDDRLPAARLRALADRARAQEQTLARIQGEVAAGRAVPG